MLDHLPRKGTFDFDIFFFISYEIFKRQDFEELTLNQLLLVRSVKFTFL